MSSYLDLYGKMPAEEFVARFPHIARVIEQLQAGAVLVDAPRRPVFVALRGCAGPFRKAPEEAEVIGFDPHPDDERKP
jgi:hypothetical protein